MDSEKKKSLTNGVNKTIKQLSDRLNEKFYFAK